jgi:hypothetical protein
MVDVINLCRNISDGVRPLIPSCSFASLYAVTTTIINKILLVDDEVDNTLLFRMVLKDNGFLVDVLMILFWY